MRLNSKQGGIRVVSVVLALALAAGIVEPAYAQAQPGMASLLGELWAKLRAVSPRAQTAQATAAPTVTAGVRGAEATESELKPYWRGDRDQDPAYRAERQALVAAQDLADSGRYAEAARAFSAFLESYPTSPFAPNARFGGGLSYAALGDRARATAAFEAFLQQDAQHPLARDAERALSALR
jgi:TolA-binding protein